MTIRRRGYRQRTTVMICSSLVLASCVWASYGAVAADDTATSAFRAPAKIGDRVAAGYVAPRLAIGQPDLQGVWTNASNTQLERPPQFSSLTMSEEEAREAAHVHPANVRQRTDDNLEPSDKLLDGKDLAEGRGYNAFWLDPGDAYANVKGTYRTSWIVEPSNGRVPYSQAGKEHAASVAKWRAGVDGPEERSLLERCLTHSRLAGPPMLNSIYNGNYRISQSPEAIAITAEEMHDARIIRLNATHQSNVVRPYFGDSIGWWEGDTLVVETVNISQKQSRDPMGMRLSENAKVIERFTRYSDEQILYEFEINDPVYYTQIWKGEMVMQPTKGDMYEYACHEGNYAMQHILSGGRAEEKRPKAEDRKSR